MVRKEFYITEYQQSFLEQLSKEGVSVSEHIRTAISEYIAKKKLDIMNVSFSPSRKGDA